MHDKIFGVGKLPMEFLKVMLERYGGHDERLIVGPQVGEDAAVLDIGDRYLVVKSDPITFATDEIGWYVVHINANDLATMGATPRWLLVTLLLPEKTTGARMVEDIFAQTSQACQALDITLCGGHTEITYGLDRPIAVGMMLGEVEKPDLVRTDGAQVGDDLLLTKGIAIEGTAVLAREKEQQLEAHIPPEMVARARGFLRNPGISVLRDAQLVQQAGRPHAMHDPTEGGLSTGLWELAQAADKAIVVNLDQVHRFPETEAICRVLGLNPLGLLASGALLIVASPDESERMVSALESEGIKAAIIGRVLDGPPAVHLETADGLFPFPSFARDELAGVFEEPV